MSGHFTSLAYAHSCTGTVERPEHAALLSCRELNRRIDTILICVLRIEQESEGNLLA